MVIGRLDSRSIASQENLTRLCIIDRQGEHSAEPLEASRPPSDIGFEQDFSIGCRAKVVPQFFEFFTKRSEIVKFAVEHNYETSINRLNRLAASREVNDGQSGVAQSDVHPGREPSSHSIGTSVSQAAGHL